MVGVPVIDTGPMTVEEFYAFTDTRPDEEKWELIEGEPIWNAAPSQMHQLIIRNVIVALTIRERELNAPWMVLPELGVRVSKTDRPEPDVPIIARSIQGGATLATSSLPSRSCPLRPRGEICVGNAGPTPAFRRSPITS